MTAVPDDELPRGQHRGRGRARRAVDWWPWLWTVVVLLWGWVTYRAAAWELPWAVVATTVVTAAAAYTVGYLIGERT